MGPYLAKPDLLVATTEFPGNHPFCFKCRRLSLELKRTRKGSKAAAEEPAVALEAEAKLERSSAKAPKVNKTQLKGSRQFCFLQGCLAAGMRGCSGPT